MNLKNLNRSTKSNIITFGIVIGFYLLIQILSAAGMVTNSFAGQLVPICAYVVMAVSLNLTVGMLGELSLGHAGFMSVGAFAGTLVWVSLYDTTFPKPAALLLAFVVGGVVAGIFGFLVGIPVLRLSGDYLAIVTLAFGEIVKNFMNACNLGVDSKGLHFSLKDTASLNPRRRRQSADQWRHGHHRNQEGFHLHHRASCWLSSRWLSSSIWSTPAQAAPSPPSVITRSPLVRSVSPSPSTS